MDASRAGPLTNLTNSATGAFALQLRGTNTDSNSITSQLTNSGASVLTLTKTDGGVWVFNPSVANTFTGAITSSGGLLGLTVNVEWRHSEPAEWCARSHATRLAPPACRWHESLQSVGCRSP